MKQTVDFIAMLAMNGDQSALDKIMYLKANIVSEKDKYFILGDE
jgi:hypothetical protein